MTTLVLGAGVIGVTTAYYLAKAGHKVTVIDRQPGVAMETSFANGGQLSACHTEPWATPATPLKIIKWFGRADAPLKFNITTDLQLWSWFAKFLMNCTNARANANMERMLRIALYSREQLSKLREEIEIQYDQLNRGILHIYSDENELMSASKRSKIMNDIGLNRYSLDLDECVKLEPALGLAANAGYIRGGIYTPDDESGDAFLFTKAIAKECVNLGVKFHYNNPIKKIVVRNGFFRELITETNIFEANNCVVALGSFSPLILAPLGIKLPVYPAKGYSVTLPLTDLNAAPRVSLIQDELKLVYSRLGDRLRIAGMAEMAGYNSKISKNRSEFILKTALKFFPACGEPETAIHWFGLRPQTPDSTPILGPTKIKNLYINTGHGTLGWTMACGSGKILADLISLEETEIDINGLDMRRFE